MKSLLIVIAVFAVLYLLVVPIANERDWKYLKYGCGMSCAVVIIGLIFWLLGVS